MKSGKAKLEKLRVDWRAMIVELTRSASEVRMTLETYAHVQRSGGFNRHNFQPTSETGVFGHMLEGRRAKVVVDQKLDDNNIVIVKKGVGRPHTLGQLDELQRRGNTIRAVPVSAKAKPRKPTQIDHATDPDHNTVIRVRLDFVVEMKGDQVIPDAFGPQVRQFIFHGLQGTKVRAHKVLPGTKASCTVVNMQRLLKAKRA